MRGGEKHVKDKGQGIEGSSSTHAFEMVGALALNAR